jgi:hypothetical protein
MPFGCEYGFVMLGPVKGVEFSTELRCVRYVQNDPAHGVKPIDSNELSFMNITN